MIRFLRLFSTFRQLEQEHAAWGAELDEKEQALSTMVGEIDALRNENQRLWRGVESANRDARQAIQTNANVFAQLRFGMKVYQDAPGIPERSEQEEPAPMTLQSPISIATQRRIEKHRKFRDEAVQQWEKAHGEPDTHSVEVIA